MESQDKYGFLSSRDKTFKAKKEEIAAAGNRPEDWRSYIEETKASLKDFSLQEKKRDLISYMYHSAFQFIPVSNTSFAHAQLLVDYATFKSEQSLEDAEKLLSHGRRYLRVHAIIHVASAEIELKKGNRQKAATILRRGGHFGAKPESFIRQAKDRLARDCTTLLHSDSKENESFDSSSGHNSSPSSGVELTGETFQPIIKHKDLGDNHINNLPACKSNTEEVQQGLDLISHYRKLKSSTSTPSLLSASSYLKRGKEFKLTQEEDYMPNPPPLILPFQDLGNTDTCGNRNRRDGNTTAESISGVDLTSDEYLNNPRHPNAAASAKHNCLLPDRTPQGSSRNLSVLSNSSKEGNQGSALKSQRWHSASNLLQSNKLTASVSKGKLLNLPPPQRVRVDQSSTTSSEDSDEDEKAKSSRVKNSSTGHGHKDGLSCSLTFGTSRPQRSLFTIPSRDNTRDDGTTSSKTFSSSQPNDHTNTKNEQSGEVQGDESLVAARNKNVTFQVKKDTSDKIASSVSKMVAHDPVTQPSHRKILQQLSSQEGSQHNSSSPPKINPQNFESVKSALPAEKKAACGPALPQASSEEIHPQLPLMKKSRQDNSAHQNEPQGNPLPVMAANPLSSGRHASSDQASQQNQQEPQKVAGTTYYVPVQSQEQVLPCSMVAPAKQTGQGGQKVIFVKGKPYIVIKLIGRGGSAKVYQVQDPESLSMRALKCVNLSCVSSEILEGYKNEIALLEKLQHCDRVIKLFSSEYVASQKKLMVVMECGETNLADFINQHAKNKDELHSVTICYLWGHMVKAVQAMHKEGVIHSDLKPANFLLVSGTIKLIDFGIANSLQQDKTSVLKNHMMGTPNYMSPEALMASNADPSETKPKYKIGTRSDVWSLGCILYQMVYGHTPFQHIRFKLEAIVNPAHEIKFPLIDDASLMDILQKCLTRDVKLRPTTDDLMNHPYLTKQKLVKPTNRLKSMLMEEEDISSASPRTLREYYLKKAEEFKSMASSLVPKMENM